jgi:hypothetical protein
LLPLKPFTFAELLRTGLSGNFVCVDDLPQKVDGDTELHRASRCGPVKTC